MMIELKILDYFVQTAIVKQVHFVVEILKRKELLTILLKNVLSVIRNFKRGNREKEHIVLVNVLIQIESTQQK